MHSRGSSCGEIDGDIAGAKGSNVKGVCLGEKGFGWKKAWPIIAAKPDLGFIPEVLQRNQDVGAGLSQGLNFFGAIT